jgi:hypothetical protein
MDTRPNATPKWLGSSGTESLSDHESSTIKIANCCDYKTSVLRRQITTALKQLSTRIQYTECRCVLRRYCPYRNNIDELSEDLRIIYYQITLCSCPCAYCQDAPYLRSCLFPQSEVVGLPSNIVKDIPDFDRLDLNSLCIAYRIYTDNRVFARNADLLYIRRQQFVVRISDSDVSSTPYIYKVFGSEDPWTDDSFELPSFESQIPIDFNGTVHVDTSLIQLDLLKLSDVNVMMYRVSVRL